MTYTHTEETIDGLTVKIELMEDGGYGCNPRDDFRGTTMVMSHRQYALPNEIDFDADSEELVGQEAIEAHIREEYDVVAFAWIRGYDHGSLHMSLSDRGCFSDPWDSGTLGFMFITRAQQEEMGTPDDLLHDVMVQELEEYDAWGNGEVYGYVIEDADGEHLDSCWGYIGDPDGYVLETARDEARAIAASLADEVRTEAAQADLPIMALDA